MDDGERGMSLETPYVRDGVFDTTHPEFAVAEAALASEREAYRANLMYD